MEGVSHVQVLRNNPGRHRDCPGSNAFWACLYCNSWQYREIQRWSMYADRLSSDFRLGVPRSCFHAGKNQQVQSSSDVCSDSLWATAMRTYALRSSMYTLVLITRIFLFARCLRGCPVRDSRSLLRQILATASPPRSLFLRHESSQIILAVSAINSA